MSGVMLLLVVASWLGVLRAFAVSKEVLLMEIAAELVVPASSVHVVLTLVFEVVVEAYVLVAIARLAVAAELLVVER